MKDRNPLCGKSFNGELKGLVFQVKSGGTTSNLVPTEKEALFY